MPMTTRPFGMRVALVTMGSAVLVGACASPAAPPPPFDPPDRDSRRSPEVTMTFTPVSKPCRSDSTYRAHCMIKLILQDFDRTGDDLGGGGISSIKATTSTRYEVAISKEEREQFFTYEFAVTPGSVAIKSKSSSVISYSGR